MASWFLKILHSKGLTSYKIETNLAPEWRNWQTRQVEGLVTLKVVQVQVLSPAVQSGQAVTANRGYLPFTFSQPLGKVLVKSFV